MQMNTCMGACVPAQHSTQKKQVYANEKRASLRACVPEQRRAQREARGGERPGQEELYHLLYVG